jgi:uncharacterized damage-inducible protein DinB
MKNSETSAINLPVQLAIKSWTGQVNAINELLKKLSDDDLKKEIAPGKNTGYYLLGHLAAVHDAMLPLLGFGSKQHPGLEKIFISSPDHSGLEFPPLAEIRKIWNDVNETLLKHFNELTTEGWLERHTAVSEADFATQPHRNKLNVLFSRTNHMSYHAGQLVLLKHS